MALLLLTLKSTDIVHYHPTCLFNTNVLTPTHLFSTHSLLPVYLIHIHVPVYKILRKNPPSPFIRIMSPLPVYYFLIKNPLYPFIWAYLFIRDLRVSKQRKKLRGWVGFQKSYVIIRVGHGKCLRLLTRWVGGVKKGQKYAYVIFEWSLVQYKFKVI